MQEKLIGWMLLFCLSFIFMASFTLAKAGEKKDTFPVQLEELSVPQFLVVLEKSAATCIIPIGVLEKHGPHLPLGTDLPDVRNVSLRAAQQEYTLIFPPYYFSQIFEARHQPGTIAYNPEFYEQLEKKMQSKRDYHAGEIEISTMLTHRPDLVHLDQAKEQSFDDQERLKDLRQAYTGIGWYAPAIPIIMPVMAVSVMPNWASL